MRHNFQSHLSPGHAGKCSPLLGNFDIREKLGTGATSEVYRVVSRETGESFALKAISKARAEAAGLTPQIFMERNILGFLKDPSVVKLFRTFQDDCFFFFLLEFAPQRSLQRVCKQLGGRLPEAETKKIVGWLIRVVFRLHCLGVIHRDLKPENVLLGGDGQLKLSDFGAACVFPAPGNEKLLTSMNSAQTAIRRRDSVSTKDSGSFGDSLLRNEFKPQELFLPSAAENESAESSLQCPIFRPTVGTLLYLSPESIEGDAKDPSADIWSIGVLAHQLLTGQFPFCGKDDMHLEASISQGSLTLHQDLSPAATDFFKAMFRRNRGLRLGCSGATPQENLQQLLEHPFMKTAEDPSFESGKIDFADVVLLRCEADWIWAKFFRSDVRLELHLRRIDVRDPRNLLVRRIDLPSLETVEGTHSGRLILGGPDGRFEFRLRGVWPRQWVDAIARQLGAS